MAYNKHSALINRILALSIIIIGAVFFFHAGPTIRQVGFLDPYFYAAYINDYRNTYERFPLTYQGTRLAYIVPDMLFQRLFGVQNGYNILRVLLVSAASAAIYSISAKRFSRSAGLITCLWLLSTYWLINSLRWTHYDGFAATYLLIAIAFYISHTTSPKLLLTLSGVFYYFAINCNLLLAAIGGLFYTSWILVGPLRTITTRIRRIRWIFVGLMASSIIISLLFFMLTGQVSLSVETTALATSKTLLNGTAKIWFVSFTDLLSQGDFLFIIPTLFAVTAIGGVVSKIFDRQHDQSLCYFELRAYTYFLSLFALMLAMHYVYYAAVFKLFYYVIYFLPAAILIMIPLIARIISNNYNMPITASFLAGFFALLINFKRSMADVQFSSPPPLVLYLYLLIALSVIIIAIVIGKSKFYPTLLVILLTSVTALNSTATEKRYASPVYADSEWATYRAAQYFQRSVNSTVPRGKSFLVWYENNFADIPYLDSIQSMFLWSYSRLAKADPPFAGMPEFEADYCNKLRDGTFLVLLGHQPDDVSAGLLSLKRHNINYRLLRSDHYTENKIMIHFQTIEIVPSNKKDENVCQNRATTKSIAKH